MRVRPQGLRLRRAERGLATVEAAVVLPVLLLMLLGVSELGRMLYQYNALSKSVRDAARLVASSVIDADTNVIDLQPSVILAARNLAVYGSPAPGKSVLPGYKTGNVQVTVVDAEHIRVAASYSYVPLFPFLPDFGFGDGDVDTSGSFSVAYTMRAL